MKKLLVNIIATLFISQLGTVSAQSPGEEITESRSAPAATTGPEKALATDKAPAPITGAFGIPLGERFDPSMVASIIDRQEQNYRGPGDIKRQGTLLTVVPNKPDVRFQRYALKTTDDNIVYAIRGDYQYDVEWAQGKKMGRVKNSRIVRNTCKDAVKALAGELENRHGKARGKGWDGEWFAFRQLSDQSDLSLRLYANSCRTGKYSIVYTDNKVRRGKQSDKSNTSPETDSLSENP